jgi:DNA-directed RNA polymerase specialized sigma24 family protein
MNLVMASSAETIPAPRLMGLPLVSRASTRWIVRAPGRRGVISPEEAAHALQARRAELRTAVDRRKDARFLSARVLDEVVDEAIAVVVMSRKPIQNEEHLQGAFWTSIGYLVAERHAGRHELRVGSQRRVAFEPLEGELAGEDEPFDYVEARDRVLRAADLISQLDSLERQVLAIMGGYGVGVKRAAKALDLPVKTVLAASRSANRKLDHVTAILAAGRMCEYRSGAVQALADGTALEEEVKVAQAHLDACSACRHEHVLLAREMASAQYKHAASAALLPAPVALTHAHGWLERLLSLAHIRMPGGGGGGGASAERAGLLLGSGAGAKVAVAAGVGLVAVAGAGVSAVHSLEHYTSAPHRHVVSHRTAHASAASSTTIAPTSEPGALPTTTTDTAHAKPTSKAPSTHPARHPLPPSRADRYLAIGGSPASTTATPSATAASTGTSREAATGSSSSPTPTGGGSLKYLGR